MGKRKLPEVNASSMADISFLLLIFFLVSTSIETDSGILVKLPPWVENISTPTKINERNLLTVLVDDRDRLLVEEQLTDVRDLRRIAKTFIMNPKGEPDKPRKPSLAVISLQNANGTSYERYITVYNELKAAYNEIWESKARQRFGASYKDLPSEQQELIRKEVPFVLSEAEPFGEDPQ